MVEMSNIELVHYIVSNYRLSRQNHEQKCGTLTTNYIVNCLPMVLTL